MKPFMETMHGRQQRCPASIAFFMVRRNIIESPPNATEDQIGEALEVALDIVARNTPRPHFEGLLWRTPHDTLGP